MYSSYSLDVDRSVPENSANVNNYSANQASSGLSTIPSQLPVMSAGAFGATFVPGSVHAPFATPYAIPFSAPELARQYTVAGPANRLTQGSGVLAQPSNLRATDNFTCSMVAINGLEKGQGCTVKKNGDAAVTVDLSGTNPFVFVNGGNKVTVVGDAQSQMCNINYSDAFDTASFLLNPNGKFDVCI